MPDIFDEINPSSSQVNGDIFDEISPSPHGYIPAVISGLRESSGAAIFSVEPSTYKPQGFGEEAAAGIGGLAGDIIPMAIGGMAGLGNPIAGMAAAFATPSIIKGIARGKPAGEIVKEAAIHAGIGGLTGAAGEFITPLARLLGTKAIEDVAVAPLIKPVTRRLLKTGAELATMTAAPPLIQEHRLPTLKELALTVIPLVGLHAATSVAGKVLKMAKNTGEHPDIILNKVQEHSKTNNIPIEQAVGNMEEATKGAPEPTGRGMPKVSTEGIPDLAFRGQVETLADKIINRATDYTPNEKKFYDIYTSDVMDAVKKMGGIKEQETQPTEPIKTVGEKGLLEKAKTLSPDQIAEDDVHHLVGNKVYAAQGFIKTGQIEKAVEATKEAISNGNALKAADGPVTEQTVNKYHDILDKEGLIDVIKQVDTQKTKRFEGLKETLTTEKPAEAPKGEGVKETKETLTPEFVKGDTVRFTRKGATPQPFEVIGDIKTDPNFPDEKFIDLKNKRTGELEPNTPIMEIAKVKAKPTEAPKGVSAELPAPSVFEQIKPPISDETVGVKPAEVLKDYPELQKPEVSLPDYRIMSLKTPEKLELKTIADVKKVFENDQLTLDGKKYSDIKGEYKPETFDNFTKVRQTKDKVTIEGKKTWINDADGGRFDTPTITFEKIPTEMPAVEGKGKGIEFLGVDKVVGMEEARRVLKNLSKTDPAFAENPTFILKDGKFNFTIDKREYNILPKALSPAIEDIVNTGGIREGQTIRLSKGYLEGKEPELFLVKKGVAPPITLASGLGGLQKAYEDLAPNIKPTYDAFKEHLHDMGSSIYKEGMEYVDFAKGMKSALGDLWDKFKQMMIKTYQSVKTAYKESRLGSEQGVVGRDIGEEKPKEEVPKVEEVKQPLIPERIIEPIKKGYERVEKLKSETADMVANLFVPEHGASAETKKALYEYTGSLAKAYTEAEIRLKDISKHITGLKENEAMDYFDKIRTGKINELSPKLQEFHQVANTMADKVWDKVVELDPDMASHKKDNHALMTLQWVFEGGEKSDAYKGGLFNPKSLEGFKGFLKRRSTLTPSEIAQEYGAKLKSTNPVKILMNTLGNEMKYVESGNLAKEAIETGRWTFVPKGERPSLNYEEIPDRIATVHKKVFDNSFFEKGYEVVGDNQERIAVFPNKAAAEAFQESYGGVARRLVGKVDFAEAGKWYAPKEEVRMLKNYLSKDLIRSTELGKFAMDLKNAWTSIELISGFHYATIAQETLSSRIGLGLQQAIRGDFSGLRDNFTSPKSALWLGSMAKEYIKDPEGFSKNPVHIEKMKEWFGNDAPKMADLVDTYFKHGGLLSQDRSLRWGETTLSGMDIIEEGKKAGDIKRVLMGGVKVPYDVAKFITRDLLFEKIIPDAKFSAFATQYEYDLKQYAPLIERGKMTADKLAFRTVKSMENRFGEMNWDNFWLDKSFKTALQFLFRSYTWNYGTWRGLGTAIKRIPEQIMNIKEAVARGEKPPIDQDVAWVLGLAATHVAEATLIGYTAAYIAGDEKLKPQTWFDYVFPKVGLLTRISIPGYVKEPFSLAESIKKDRFHIPVSYVQSKMSGFLGKFAEVYRNKDYYGNKVYQEDESLPQRALDVGKHLVVLPFSVSSFTRSQKEGASEWLGALNALGFNKAPWWVDKSEAETMAVSLQRKMEGGRTREQAERYNIEKEAVRYLREHETLGKSFASMPQELRDRLIKLTPIMKRNIIKNAYQIPLQVSIKNFTPEDAMKVWDVATAEEKKKIRVEVIHKILRSRTLNPKDKRDYLQKIREGQRIGEGMTPPMLLSPMDMGAPPEYYQGMGSPVQ